MPKSSKQNSNLRQSPTLTSLLPGPVRAPLPAPLAGTTPHLPRLSGKVKRAARVLAGRTRLAAMPSMLSRATAWVTTVAGKGRTKVKGRARVRILAAWTESSRAICLTRG